MNPLFTIGHSTHEIGEFLGLLRQHEIDAVADVRSQPYSSRFPWFSQKPLESALEEAGVRYVFLGQELGARRDEPEVSHARPRDDRPEDPARAAVPGARPREDADVRHLRLGGEARGEPRAPRAGDGRSEPHGGVRALAG